MPLLKGKANIGRNIEELARARPEMSAQQRLAIALRKAREKKK